SPGWGRPAHQSYPSRASLRGRRVAPAPAMYPRGRSLTRGFWVPTPRKPTDAQGCSSPLLPSKLRRQPRVSGVTVCCQPKVRTRVMNDAHLHEATRGAHGGASNMAPPTSTFEDLLISWSTVVIRFHETLERPVILQC